MSGSRKLTTVRAAISVLLIAACLSTQPLLSGCAPLENLFEDFFPKEVPLPFHSEPLPEDDDPLFSDIDDEIEIENEIENEITNEIEHEVEYENSGYRLPVFDIYNCSSFINNNKQEYGDLRAFDGDFSTSWQEYAEGSGVCEWISCSASSPQYVRSVTIVPGNCDNEVAYIKNGRPTRVGISLDDEYGVLQFYCNLEIKDRFRESSTFFFEPPVLCSSVRITILEAVDGTEWSDTAIAEIIIA